MKKVFLRYYNAINLGDDLFVHVIAERYKDIFYINRRAKTQVFSAYPNIKPSENLISNTFSRIKSRLTKKWQLGGQKKISNCDFFVYVGGSIFMEKGSLSPWISELSLYKSLQIPYYILGSNFGPYKTSEFKEIIQCIVAGSADTCFRDSLSYEHFRGIPAARLAADIAFSLNTSEFDLTKNEKKAVISVIDASKRFDNRIATRYETEMANLVINLKAQGYDVSLMSFCEKEGDEEAAERIRKLTSSKVPIYRYRGNLKEALQEIASAEIMVGSRFHAVILGLIFGSRVLPIAYSGKTLNVLKDLEFHGPIVEMDAINHFEGEKFDFGSLFPQDVSKEISRAESQFSLLDNVLNRKS